MFGLGQNEGLLSETEAGLVATGGDSGVIAGTIEGAVYSPDGTRIAFVSTATNLATGAVAGTKYVYVASINNNVISDLHIVSTKADGTLAAGDSTRPAWSPDGTKLAFESKAALEATDINAGTISDIYWVGLNADNTVASVNRLTKAGGGGTNGSSHNPQFSPDGTSILYESLASNQALSGGPADTNNASDIFIKSLTGTTATRISLRNDGSQTIGNSSGASFSPDGTMVLFESVDNGIVSSDTNNSRDVFLRTISTGQTVRVSVGSTGGEAFGVSQNASFSPDGKMVVFTSTAANLTNGDGNTVADVFIKFLANSGTNSAGQIFRLVVPNSVSGTTPNGTAADGAALNAFFSPDGTRILFTSAAENLLPIGSPTATGNDVFVQDLYTQIFSETGGTATTGGAAISNGFFFADSDVGDTHQVTIDPVASPGTFSAFVQTETQGLRSGFVSWSYTPADSGTVAQALNNGQTYNFNVHVTDTAGGSFAQQVSVTVNVTHVADSAANLLAFIADPTGVQALNQQVSPDYRVLDTGANIAALSAANMELLGGMTGGLLLGNLSKVILDASDGTIRIGFVPALAAIGGTMAFVDADTVTVFGTIAEVTGLSQVNHDLSIAAHVDAFEIADTGANIAALTVNTIAGLPGMSVTTIGVTDGAVSLSGAQVDAFAGVNLGFNANTTAVTLADTGAAIAGLSLQQIADAASKVGVRAIDVTDSRAVLSLQQMTAVFSGGMTFAAADDITMSGTGTELVSLTTNGLSLLAGIGVDHYRLRDTGATIAGITTGTINLIASFGTNSIDATDNVLAMDVAKLRAFTGAGYSRATDDLLTLTDTAANIASLTDAELNAFLPAGSGTTIDLTDVARFSAATMRNLAVTHGVAFTTGDQIAVEDNAAAFRTLSAADRATFDAKNLFQWRLFDSAANIQALTTGDLDAFTQSTHPVMLDISDAANTATYSVAFEQGLINRGIGQHQSDQVTLQDTAAVIVAITDQQVTDFGNNRVTALRIADTGANVSALNLSQIARLDALNANHINLTDNAASLTLGNARAYLQAQIGFDTSDAVTVRDTIASLSQTTQTERSNLGNNRVTAFVAAETGATLKALTTAAIDDLAAHGVTRVDATDNALTLDYAAAGQFVTRGIGFDPSDAMRATGSLTGFNGLADATRTALFNANAVLTVVDTAATIGALNAAAIATLSTKGLRAIDLNDNLLTLDAARAKAFSVGAGRIAFDATDAITLTDTAAALTGISATDLQAMAQNRVTTLNLADTGANVAALSAAQIAALAGIQAKAINLTDNAATLAAAQARALQNGGFTFAANDQLTIADTAANLIAITKAEADGMAQNRVVATNLVDTGAGLSALTLAQITTLDQARVVAINLSDNAATLDMARAKALQSLGFAYAADDRITVADSISAFAGLTDDEWNALRANRVTGGLVVDTGGALAAASATDLAAIVARADRVNLSDNAATLSLASYSALGSLKLAADDAYVITGTTKADKMTARGGTMTLDGGKRADTLTGGATTDWLIGGAGKDKLIGGSGADTFVFNSKAGAKNADTITLFSVPADTIALDNAIFTALTDGALAKSEFRNGPAAKDADDHVIYHRKSGQLFYDDDGTGAHAAQLIATFADATHPKLTFADVLVM